MFENSFILNSNGIGLLVESEDGADVTVNVDGASSGSNDAGSITGTIGIDVNGFTSTLSSFALNNLGHIEGTNGAGVSVAGQDLVATIGNHSYASMIGADGFFANGDAQIDFDNKNGLTAGLNGDGLDISDIDGSGPAAFAVRVDNRQGGVISGSEDGIRIVSVNPSSTEDGTDVLIDNSGVPEENTPGGLILGVSEDGIGIANVRGNVAINNNFTQQGSIDLTKLDPLVFGELTALQNGVTTGIWGNEDGIRVVNVDEHVGISNVNGRVVGLTEDGIFVAGVGGGVGIDNHGTSSDVGGLAWGNWNGINVQNVLGSVNINNDLGTAYGVFDEGIFVASVQGATTITNFGGLAFGRLEDGIDVFNNEDGLVKISNGASDGKVGIIYGRFNGIDVNSEDGTEIKNFSHGAILGSGEQFFNPVIEVNTFGSPGNAATSDIYNAGLISPVGEDGVAVAGAGFVLPTFAVSGEPFDAPNVPSVTIDYDKILADASDIAAFSGSGGTQGSIANLGLYGTAAGLFMIDSESGSVSVLNDTSGLMIGRVNLLGSTGGEVADAIIKGNTIVNYGKWFTTDSTVSESSSITIEQENILSSLGEDAIYNLGLIQTAFRGPGAEGGAVNEKTTFLLDDFYNGGAPTTAEVPSTSGVVSMIDGATGDETDILGNYHGATKPGFSAYVGVDVFFAQGVQGSSDLLSIGQGSLLRTTGVPVAVGGDVDGSTGIIVHKTNATPGGVNNDGILVVTASGIDKNPLSQQCFGVACRLGNTFYISSFSEDYVNVNGIGAVQDGAFAWYLTEQAKVAPPDPDFVMKSTIAPWTGGDEAGLVTGAQNIWFDTSGVVEDHIYGNHFPAIGSGGGGADLAADEPTPPGEASGDRHGIWARIAGNWTNRDASVADSVFGTVDTSADQSTYSVLGGADFSPNGLEDGFRFGILGGYVTSNIDYAVATESADYKGGLLGGYIAYTKGGFYADTQVNWTPLDVTYHTAFGDVDTNASSVGFLANTGYRMDRGHFFVEPIASLTYVDATVDDVAAGGAAVDFSNGQSLQGGVGGRVGTNFATSSGTTTEISLLGKLWNEFEDANQVTVTQGPNATTFSDNIGGLFGEVSASATIFSSDRSVSGFVSGGAKFSSDFTSWSAKAGVRRTF